MLTGKQRAYLKSLAMEIEPTVYIGKNELTENVLKEIDDEYNYIIENDEADVETVTKSKEELLNTCAQVVKKSVAF